MKSYQILMVLPLVFSCSVGPQPIEYGHDQCSFCRMTIMDQRYGSELITSTGKVYKFDAIECMINYLQNGSEEYQMYLVSDYSNPGHLIKAERSFFLRAVTLPSPMGMYITGFETSKKAEEYKQKNSGELYNWKQLNRDFNKLPSMSNADK